TSYEPPPKKGEPTLDRPRRSCGSRSADRRREAWGPRPSRSGSASRVLGVVDDEPGDVAPDVRSQGASEREAPGDPREVDVQGAIALGPFPEVVVDALGVGTQHDPGESVPAHQSPLAADRISTRPEEPRLGLRDRILPGAQVVELVETIGI